jgi:DNA-binding NtrC family response regulator
MKPEIQFEPRLGILSKNLAFRYIRLRIVIQTAPVGWEARMTEATERCDVLLIAADLNERRLVYGELLEAGYHVKPVPGLALALGDLLQKSVEPRLILIDVRDDAEATPQAVQHLLSLVPGVPAMAVVGVFDRSAWEAIQPRFAALLARPVTIGKIVEVVKQTLPVPNRIP